MTQFSWDYSCVPDTGDAGSFTAEKLAAARMIGIQTNPQDGGLIYWNEDTPANVLFPGTPPGFSTNTLDGFLEPSEPGGGLVRIASGIGMVLGRFYINDTDIDFDIDSDPGQASATDLIVLRRNNLATVEQSIRVVRKKATAPSTTAVLQQDGAIWEIPLAEVDLTAGGVLSGIRDARKLAYAHGTMIKLEEIDATGVGGDFVFDNIPPLFDHLRIVATMRDDEVATNVQVTLTFNNDTGNNYNYAVNETDGAGTLTTTAALTQAAGILATIPASSATSGVFALVDMVITNYLTSAYKMVQANIAGQDGIAGVTNLWTGQTTITYAGTADITRIDILSSTDFANVSKATLYGII